MSDSNVTNIDDGMWEVWAAKIGHRPIFLFKAAMVFLEEKNLVDDFDVFVQDLLDKAKKDE